MSKKIYNEEEKIDCVSKCKLHLEPIKSDGESEVDPYVYQYRSLESFWSIIESDSFWATNARFSNDNEEQLLGQEKIWELLKDIEGQRTKEIQGDCYIVCFCDDGDRLSQWRGYANEGVAIGFDFRNIRPFFIKKKEIDREKEEYLCIYNSCYEVQYVTEKTSKYEFADKFRLSISGDKSNIQLLKKKAQDVIPYVKHHGFKEEAESRLMFSDNDSTDLKKCIHYRNIDGLKVPYIIVKAGDKKKKKTCIIRLNINESVGKELKKRLLIKIKQKGVKNVKVINCFEQCGTEIDDSVCYGCTLRQTYTTKPIQEKRQRCRYHKLSEKGFYAENTNEIYLSDSQNQEEVCDFLYNFLEEYTEYQDLKIWCEGHLPVRKIRVGSSRGKEVIMESIKHYCKQHYWLRSVDVIDSPTPYRSKLI